MAAVEAALASAATGVRLLTVNAEGSAAVTAAGQDRCRVIVVPVAECKDGFLATHSLVGMATCMLAAADILLPCSDLNTTIDRLAEEVKRITAAPIAIDIRPGDTVFVLHDPQCRTIATLIETSL